MTVIERFYDDNTQYEWERQERHRTEFAVAMRALQDYLPKPPAVIYDIGGGPGRYSIALAGQGYTVTLVDLSLGCLDFARRKAREAGVEMAGYIHANAADLAQFQDTSCDVVLLMGPLYHLLTLSGRQQALAEARRVLEPGGLIMAAFITRYAPLRWAAKNAPQWLVERRPDVEALLSTGVIQDSQGFTDAYFIHPSEVKPLMESAGFETLNLIGCEGLVSQIEEQMNQLTGELWEAWADLNYRLGKDPCLHSAVEHLLYVGRK